jgi:hypothetical protein
MVDAWTKKTTNKSVMGFMQLPISRHLYHLEILLREHNVYYVKRSAQAKASTLA